MSQMKLILILAIGLLTICLTIYITANNPLAFLNIPGMILVFGGTLVATFLSYGFDTLKAAFFSIGSAMKKPSNNLQHRVETYSETLNILKSGNLKEAEKNIQKINSPYLETAASMMVDGTATEDIMRVLDWQIEKTKSADKTNAEVFLTMASYSPAFGMVGTLIGLVNMLETMQMGEFEHIGSNMALALITTFYGILLANILFKPLSVKLKQKMHEDVVLLTVAKEAVIYLAEGRPPSYTKELLNKYLEKIDGTEVN